MTEPLIMRVRDALNAVISPTSGRSIVAEGMVADLAVDNGVARLTIDVGALGRHHAEAIIGEAEAAIRAVGGVRDVNCLGTGHGQRADTPQNAHTNPLGLSKKRSSIETAAASLADVKHVIAIASGKGGVGKSTVAANLAVAFAQLGLRTGLMDADIYGPSLPTLFGVSSRPPTINGKLQPIKAHGVSAMSIGWLVDEAQALAWRGPMVMGAVRQLFSDVDWGALDLLLIDTPPGTGDAHLSLIQSKRLNGAVIVSTPQEMALADVRRGVALFRKTDIPVLGVIENMAWLETADGSRSYLFGEGGAEAAAKELNAPFLGAIPLYPDIRESADAGKPIAAGDSRPAALFRGLAEKILAAIRPDPAP